MEEKKNQKPKVNMPRFNLNWLYIIILIVFFALYFFKGDNALTKNINYTEFKEYVDNGYVNKVIAYDDNTAEIFIKP